MLEMKIIVLGLVDHIVTKGMPCLNRLPPFIPVSRIVIRF